jgi:hypothetical protein
MDQVALAVLKKVEAWEWPVSSRRIQEPGETNKFKAIALNLLSGFITQSQLLSGTLLDEFWNTAEKCHPQLEDNSESRLLRGIFILTSSQSQSSNARWL